MIEGSWEQIMNELEAFKTAVDALRHHIQIDAKATKDLKTAPMFHCLPPIERADYPEALANVMLAYRHLEDARMRLGKVLQAMDGGVSVYDK